MNYKHGLAHSRLDAMYKGMKDRCYNPRNKRYKIYGARGIAICDEWLSDKNNFFQWAKEQGYDDSLPRGVQTIDRIDVNSHYSPENCRFVSVKEQNNNRRTNVIISCAGEQHTIAEWGRIKGIRPATIWNRLTILGWSAERALNTIPVRGSNQFSKKVRTET